MQEHCIEWLDHVPDLVGLSSAHPDSFPCLLDHAAHGSQAGHSILMFSSGVSLVQHPDGELTGPGEGTQFFERLESWYQKDRAIHSVPADVEGDLPFTGGWFLFLGYELAATIEPTLKLPPNETGLPDAIATRCPGAIIVVHAQPGQTHARPRAVVVAETEKALRAILKRVVEAPVAPIEAAPDLEKISDENPEKFQSGVRDVLEYLKSGDVFQVNISRHWSGHFDEPVNPAPVYRRLRQTNPAPFAGLMQWNNKYLLSSSPERLVEVRGRDVQTRPIAGTRSRGNDEEQDLALSRELIQNVKERAEHIMLIDLERNDMGRVCIPGSIIVSELMVIESYAHVHHIVSNIQGKLRSDASPVDAVRAVFPGGTITGCPKVRCMEIIAELEQEGRGFYTGSMGYLGVNGNMDLNILIRSMLLQEDQVSFRTGAGIVADSIPGRELEETREKARGLLLALQTEVESCPNA